MRTICFILISGAAIFFAGCDMEPKSYAAEIEKMKDTIFASFPTVNRVSVEVKHDFGSEVNITLGDAQLYEAPEAERQKVADETTQIIHYVFAADMPEKGNLFFVKEENTIVTDKAAMKTYKLPLTQK